MEPSIHELALREELTRRIEKVIVDISLTERKSVQRLMAEAAVEEFLEFIREGNRVRDLAEGAGLSWH